MQIEVLLKKVLREYGLDRHGVATQIADELGIHRHTVGKLYRNQVRNISLHTLGLICEWLSKKGVPREKLPSALLGAPPSELWKALSVFETVTIYLGEREKYNEVKEADRVLEDGWISLRDAYVLSDITRELSEGVRPHLDFEYVPFKVMHYESNEAQQRALKVHREHAERIYNRLWDRGRKKQSNSILIGSQRVNYLVEFLVASLFGCEPFRSSQGAPKVPFYLRYRHSYEPAPSCFGGICDLQGYEGADTNGKTPPGVYFRDRSEKWVLRRWEKNKSDTGVLVVAREPGTNLTLLAIIGFSYDGTVAFGRKVCIAPRDFWPPYADANGMKVGVYIGSFPLQKPGEDTKDTPARLRKEVGEVVALDRSIIEKYSTKR